MYKIEAPNNINKEPWNISLEKRCKKFNEALCSGKKVALMIYEKADTSTFRYRCYNLYQWTERSNRWQCIYFFLDEIDIILDYLNLCSLVVIVRVKWQHKIDTIIYRARKLKKKIIFDVDDLIFDLNYLNLVANTLNVNFETDRDYEFWFAHISRIGFTASKADGFTCTNSFLGQHLQKLYRKPYQIIPNSLNTEQLEMSSICIQEKNEQLFKAPFSIGYFSGTPSHINDFKVVYKELLELLHNYPEIRLDVVGFMEFPPDLEPYIRTGRVTFQPLVDFVELQRLIAQVDVNIVPLVNNIFTNCKSELKFFEGAVVNTLTLATPIYSYKNAIINGETGYLCNEGQWYNTVENIYLNYSLNKRNGMIDKARKFVVDNYMGLNFVKKIEESYDKLIGM